MHFYISLGAHGTPDGPEVDSPKWAITSDTDAGSGLIVFNPNVEILRIVAEAFDHCTCLLPPSLSNGSCSRTNTFGRARVPVFLQLL